MTTFSAELARQLRGDAGRPFITFYDHASGERIELSLTTYANWVAKAAGLLVEESELERGSRLLVDLPTHWMSTVFLGAAWTVGAIVVLPRPGDSFVHTGSLDAVVTGPAGLEGWAESGVDSVLACSLAPLARGFTDPLPEDVLDVGVAIWSQPDAFTPWDPPTDDDIAIDMHGEHVTQSELMKAAAAGSLLTDGGRLFSATNPASPPGIVTLTEPLTRGGSLVLVRHLVAEQSQATYDAERATHRF